MSHNPIRPWRDIERRTSRQIMVGNVPVGGGAPIAVQTMTNTDSSDVKATLGQVLAAAEAGADIVRISCPDVGSTAALKEITRESPVPIVADIHFHYKRAIEAAEAGAACLRINPGNIGDEGRVREVIKAAKDYGCSIRIGVNAGSLERHLLEKYGEPCPRRWWNQGWIISVSSKTMTFASIKSRSKPLTCSFRPRPTTALPRRQMRRSIWASPKRGALFLAQSNRQLAWQPALGRDRGHDPRKPVR